MFDLQSYIIFFLIWLISTLLVRTIFSKTRSGPCLPPGPRVLPVIGHLHLLGPIPHQAFHKLSTRYGPLIRLRLGSVPAVVASSPDTAREILKTHESSFASRPVSSAIRLLTYGSADFSFAPYGPYWKFMKKLCMSELLNGPTLDLMLPIRRRELQRFLQLLLKRSEAGEAVDVGAELLTMANNVISRMTMSQRCSNTEGEGDVRKLVNEVAEITGKFNLADFIGFCKNLDLQGLEKRCKDVHQRFDRMMERIIKEHEEERKLKKEKGDNGAKDLLDILLEISEDDSAEMKLTKENIKAFILDIFVAGTDTSAITTEWVLAELINNPTMLQKAREEIDAVVGKERLVEESDIPSLPYIQAIVKETLRLHPTGPLIMRMSTEDSKIGGFDIPTDTQIFVNVWAIGRDPDHWEDPLEFRPERFMPSSDSSDWNRIDIRGQHFHLLPFGSGRRGCPGTSLAMQVVQTTVAALVQSFEWKTSSVGENIAVDMTEGPGITLPRAKPLVCFPIARLNPFPSLSDHNSEVE